jgi:hypothetical protein
MKTLRVVRTAAHLGTSAGWEIVGLSSGRPVYLEYHLPYPQTEWPELGSIKGEKSMLAALYDKWQTSDELEKEGKAHGGLRFNTPYGDFATSSFHVVRMKDLAKVQTAVAQGKKWEEFYLSEMNRQWNHTAVGKAARVAYGTKFDDWPRELVDAYWKIENAVHAAAHKAFPQKK